MADRRKKLPIKILKILSLGVKKPVKNSNCIEYEHVV